MRGRGAAAAKVAEPAVDERPAFEPVGEMVAAAKGPQIPGGWQRIVTTIFTLDERAIFERVTAFLSFDGPAHRKEYGELIDELDRATEIANDASLLRENAKAALSTFEADVEVWQADQRHQARAALEADKRANDGKGKQITEGDVLAKMAALFPDDYRATAEKLARAKGAVAHLDQLHARAVDRFKALDAMVRGSRKQI